MITYEYGILTVDEPEADQVMITLGGRKYHSALKGVTQLPMPYGDGTYIVEVFQRVQGDEYHRLKFRKVIAANTADYMIRPNLYVPRNESWGFAVELAHAFGTTDAWQAVRDWFRRCFKYDDKQALTLERLSAFPDPVTCWRRSRGFGQDAASMAAGMFRAVGIPTRLCIGHADGSLHAWAESVIDGGIRRFDPRGTPVQIYHRERWF